MSQPNRFRPTDCNQSLDSLRWLSHADVASAIWRALCAAGTPNLELDDAVADVRAKVLTALRNGATVPRDLAGMKAYCATVARRHAVDTLRSAAERDRELHDDCDPDECGTLDFHVEQRDPVDASRQLELLAQLFRDGKMPEHGVEILEGVASGCSCRELGEELGISEALVARRLHKMRRIFRAALSDRYKAKARRTNRQGT